MILPRLPFDLLTVKSNADVILISFIKDLFQMLSAFIQEIQMHFFAFLQLGHLFLQFSNITGNFGIGSVVQVDQLTALEDSLCKLMFEGNFLDH